MTALLVFASLLFATVNEQMLVSSKWLAEHSGKRVVIVHVGDPAKFAAAHIPGAVLLTPDKLVATRAGVPNEVPPLSELQKTLEELGIGNRDRVVIYGDDPLLAARLFFTLDYLGHGKRVSLLDGGLAQWQREGRAVATGESKPTRRAFTARVEQERLVFLTQLKKFSASATLVDARPPAQFGGAEAGDGVSRPGHIPGAQNVFWKNALTPDGLLRPLPELQQMHATVPPDRAAITYCRTGMQSSFEYFLLRYLGYNVAMYDGSFLEWSNDLATEVEK